MNLLVNPTPRMDIAGQPDTKLYEKLLDIFLSLRDLRDYFQCYSANDIKKLIASKMKMKTLHEPAALQKLYMLETAIRNLRESMEMSRVASQRT